MAKLVTKFSYISSEGSRHPEIYAKYIATRPGAEKIDDSRQFLPATKEQVGMIQKLLHDFPDSRQMHEYNDYLIRNDIGSASEFIARAVEDNLAGGSSAGIYAKYIGTRPQAEKIGRHALFTDDGVPVRLNAVAEELSAYQGNVWTVILSLQREDAERLGYNTGDRWRTLLRSKTDELADAFHIPLENLKWYAAFHNESHHPHVHLMVFSSVPGEGRLTAQGIMKLRSSFAKDIFAQDLISIYQRKTASRDALRAVGRDYIAEVVYRLNSGTYINIPLEEKLLQLSERLKNVSGRKKYGYLPAGIKRLVDEIFAELAADPRIEALYDLWYQNRESVLRTYTDTLPARTPLTDNPVFKPIKNAIIQEAINIAQTVPTQEDEETVRPVTELFMNLYTIYNIHGIHDSIHSDPAEMYRQAAAAGDSFAEYQLGKMYLYGSPSTEQDVGLALQYFRSAAAHGNTHAGQYIYAIESHRHWRSVLGSMRLFRAVTCLFRDRWNRDNGDLKYRPDRKLRRDIEEKMEAHGLKHG